MSPVIQDRLGKFLCLGMVVMALEVFGQKGAYPAGLIPSNAVPAFFRGMGDFFIGLGIFAPIGVLVALFCLDGMTSRR